MSPDEKSPDEPKVEATPAVEEAPAQSAPVETVQQQPQAQTPAGQQNVQYVVQEKSLKGVGGWLIFFMICFGFAAVYGLIGFFVSLAAVVEGSASAPLIVNLIFTPLIAAASVLAIVYTAMQRKLGKLVSMGAYALGAVYSTILIPVTTIAGCNAYNSVVNSYSYYGAQATDCPGAGGWVGIIGGILVSWVISGLFALYFVLSKRVKATLVK